MVGILDIADTSEVVAGVNCYGLSVDSIAKLFIRFPELKRLVSGDVDSIAEKLFETAPAAIAAIIVMGTRSTISNGITPVDVVEAKAANLPVEIQYDMIAAIAKLTMPGGVGPFVERINKITALMDGFAQGVEQTREQKSPVPSNS